MSGFFSRGNNNYEKVNTPQPGAGGRDPYGGYAAPPRPGLIPDLAPATGGYNDPSQALFERRQYGSQPSRHAVPAQRSNGRYVLPTLESCLILISSVDQQIWGHLVSQ